jgi:hypothetical protein
VVEGLRREVPALARELRAEIPPFDPSKPDDPLQFHLAASPLKDPAKPDGD